jgi:Protein kinase domain
MTVSLKISDCFSCQVHRSTTLTFLHRPPADGVTVTVRSYWIPPASTTSALDTIVSNSSPRNSSNFDCAKEEASSSIPARRLLSLKDGTNAIQKSRTVESKLIAMIVSTSEKPFPFLSRPIFCFALIFLGLFTAPLVLGQVPGTLEPQPLPKAVTASFLLEPTSGTVWRRTGEGQVTFLGRSGDEVSIGLTELEASGGRPLLIEFRVPLWGPDWVSPVEFVEVGSLQTHSRYPQTGARKLDLSRGQLFQAWTKSHLALSLSILLGLIASAVVGLKLLFKRRSTRGTKNHRIGSYVMGERIGAGGMGEVFTAFGEDGHSYAMKLLRPLLHDNAQLREQFDRELNSGLKLQHPNLCQLYGYGLTEDGRVYMVSELLRGDTLKTRLTDDSVDRRALAVEVLEQVGSALDYLHSQKIVHQDVKPSNIWVATEGTIKLLDLGVARSFEDPEGPTAGTPLYMAPEQFLGSASPAADQYALGLVLYEILTGSRPFEDRDASVLAHLRSSQQPPSLSRIHPELAGPIDQAVLKMLEPEPSRRFPNLKEVREILMPLLQ